MSLEQHHPAEGGGVDDVGDDDDGNTHRAFLQALLARQTLTFATAQPLIAHIETAAHPDRPRRADEVGAADVDGYLTRANAALSPFDLEVRSAAHQTTRERVWALVNTTSDALTQMATLHGADDIAFVKRVLDAMFAPGAADEEVMAVPGMRALRLAKPPVADPTQATQATGITVAQAEKVLESMVLEGWFEKSERGYYSLTPRALMELRGWLVDTYNDQAEDSDGEADEAMDRIKFCAACRDIVTVGQRCPTEHCPARLHNHCVGKMFRAQGGRQECPTCRTAWEDALPVGEEADTTNGRGQRGAGRRVNGSSARHTQVTISDDDNSDNDNEEDEEGEDGNSDAS